ncbi:hypothetical protein [Hymenobacter qilianensis]|uniref:Uncharacterized protein n=1 Tax=Hymenobacter qilianensis TaxID=1385715 RepID=A0A7H0GYZ3_9BACT|nr:hypothetical protein [Hymenobacter qilianensis]QNP53509.1 hypothetical protein H9L05_08070 [Hymenobacter qilianensis]
MMESKYVMVYILFVFFISSCDLELKNTGSKDALIKNNELKEVAERSSSALNKSENHFNSKILGAWTNNSSENAIFDIRKDSIYYVDDLISYKYSMNRDSIKIDYLDWAFVGAVSFARDSLIISSKDGVTKYWKFVN